MKYYEDKSDRKMELKLLSLSEDDKLIRECMEQASAFSGCLGKMGVTEILCDRKKAQELGADCQITGIFTGGELTAFACAFEYTGLKRNGRKWLNPGDKECCCDTSACWKREGGPVDRTASGTIPGQSSFVQN